MMEKPRISRLPDLSRIEGADSTLEKPIDHTEIYADALRIVSGEAGTDEPPEPEYYQIKPAHQWLVDSANTPASESLFGELWFEGELCILFADTGQGKSVLAIQIAEALAGGRPFESELKTPSKPKKVLLFDFELSAKQIEPRYSVSSSDPESTHYEDHYAFSENFLRSEVDPDAIPPDFANEEEYMFRRMASAIVETEATVVIVDNITWLNSNNEKAHKASALMKSLKKIKKKLDISILALAHTPKRDPTKPITVNDLAGSKMLINYVDSCFAIGESSRDQGIKYFKQIKVRNASKRYGADNVIVCRLHKPHNFLHFEFLSYDQEAEHLKTYTDKDKDELIADAKEMYKNGRTQQEIADILKVSKMTVSRYLKQGV